MVWYRTTLRLDPTLHADLKAHAGYFGCSQQHLIRELLRVSLEKMQEFRLLSPEDQSLFMPEGTGVVVLPSLPDASPVPGEGRKKARPDKRAEMIAREKTHQSAHAAFVV